jgi:serine/threonine protein kinase
MTTHLTQLTKQTPAPSPEIITQQSVLEVIEADPRLGLGEHELVPVKSALMTDSGAVIYMVEVPEDISKNRTEILRIPRIDTEDAVEAALREIEISEKVSGAHIASALGSGIIRLADAELPFIGRKSFVDGSLVEAKSAGWINATALTLEALKGVHEMHQQGLVHGDISPENVRVDTGSRSAAISGFRNTIIGNEARAALGLNPNLVNTAKAHVSQAVLNPDFTAPEILNGSLPSTQSDVYEAARTLAYAINGSVRRESVEYDEFSGQWIALTPESDDLRPKVPNGVRFAIQHALDPQPGYRQTMSQLIGTVGEELGRLEPAS